MRGRDAMLAPLCSNLLQAHSSRGVPFWATELIHICGFMAAEAVPRLLTTMALLRHSRHLRLKVGPTNGTLSRTAE